MQAHRLPIIEVSGLVKEFRRHKRFPGPLGALRTLVTREYSTHRAVDGVSFAIGRGEAVGYVGPNGAGKSTTIKMLTGILVPTSGRVLVNGRVPHEARRENAKRIGVVFGQRSQLWWDLPLLDSFDLHRRVYDIPAERYRQNLGFCERVLGVGEFAEVPVRQLSLGQRMRAELAMALLHEPEVLFLDEPTIGLDVLAKDSIREFLRDVNRERGVTIILTTHDLKDIEEICPRLMVINTGRVIYDGTVRELKARLGDRREIAVEFERDPGPVELPGAELVRDEGARKRYRFERGRVSALDLLRSLEGRYPGSDVSLEEANIEDTIRELYRQMGREVPESEELDTWTRGRAVVQ